MYYFASDMHLGSDHGRMPSALRERLLVAWLDAVAADAKGIYLAGDVFDFWFEYKRVVPKGYTRFLGKLAELTDRGIEIHLFMGNHDMWMCGYLARECGLTLHRRGEEVTLYGKRLFIDHGDRITDREHWLHRLRGAMLRSSTLRWLFAHLVPPGAALWMGQRWSVHSRLARERTHRFLGEGEPLVKFARRRIAEGYRPDYFVFGHIHYPALYDLGGDCNVLFTGDWLQRSDYAVLRPDGRMRLEQFRPAQNPDNP